MKDNRGISLVELIIAVAVVGILMVPLFTTFVNSAKINQDALLVQNESALAQSFIEDIKASNLSETLHIPLPDDTSSSDTGSRYPWPTEEKSDIYNNFTQDEKDAADAINDGAYNNYTYEIPAVTSSTGRKYDVEVKLEPVEYSEQDPTIDNASNINMIEIPTLPEIDVAKSPVIAEQLKAYDYDSFEPRSTIETKFIVMYGDTYSTSNLTTPRSVADLVGAMHKKIDITIKPESNRALITATLTFTNDYYPGKEIVVNAYQNYYSYTNSTDDPSDVDVEGQMDIYMFWDPSPYGGDIINIDNQTDTRFNFYIFREQDRGDEDTSNHNTYITIGNASYDATNGDGRLCADNINLKTNIGKDAVSYDEVASTRCYKITVTLYAQGDYGGEIVTQVISTKEVYSEN